MFPVYVRMYSALHSTVMTESELTEVTYEQMRARLVEEMGLQVDTTRRKSDQEILSMYHQCENYDKE